MYSKYVTVVLICLSLHLICQVHGYGGRRSRFRHHSTNHHGGSSGDLNSSDHSDDSTSGTNSTPQTPSYGPKNIPSYGGDSDDDKSSTQSGRKGKGHSSSTGSGKHGSQGSGGTTSSRKTPDYSGTPNSSAPSGKYAQGSLKAHNDARTRHGMPPVEWDSQLEEAARAYSQKLVSSGCSLRHSSPGERRNQGENLAMASWKRGPEGPVQAFMSESLGAAYNHATQVLWKTTKRVGCAEVMGGSSCYITTCRYSPPGNVNPRPYKWKTG